ncbi:hypothetical protein [Nonomuraea sp. NPDC050643]|uniref:hypothetical protein n=1 Tax=Nonomuraea sp. NPDC050643 TaxID=3155660 RepID=UPI0033C83723
MASTVIAAWLALGMRDRQLAVLRLTYPQWTISYERASNGWIWRAAPSWQLSAEMLTAGARPRLVRGNPVALMAELSHQTVIIRNTTRRRT